MHERLSVVALSLLFVFPAAVADEMGPRFVHSANAIRKIEPPRSTLAALAQEEPDIVLPPLSARLLAGETDPPTVGVVRALAGSSALGSPARSVRSTGAVRVRLHLTGVSLPAGSVAWVSGEAGDAVPFGEELLLNDTIWTPSVGGEVIRLLLPAGARADIAAVGHQTRSIAGNGMECFLDASCASFDNGELSSSTAVLNYVRGGLLYFCSGGLIASSDETEKFLLTANHCISTAAEAASVEAEWDFRTTSCNGSNAAVQRTYGASLLVTSLDTDLTLLRMNSVPGYRWWMGWSTNVVEPGTLLYRVSYPQDPISLEPLRQVYSITSAVNASFTEPRCEATRPRPRYLYSTRVTGGIRPGSSGSPVTKAGGYIVGQLYGFCSYGDQIDGCANSTSFIDGSLRASYPLLQPFLNPKPASGCTPDSKTVCLLGSRFRVSVNYRNQFASPPQPGDFVAARLNASAVNPDVGIFGLTDPQATEIMVRIADARPYAPRFDVYYGGLTDLEYWVNVTDTVTGTTRSYYNAPGKLSAGLDRGSFPAN